MLLGRGIEKASRDLWRTLVAQTLQIHGQQDRDKMLQKMAVFKSISGLAKQPGVLHLEPVD